MKSNKSSATYMILKVYNYEPDITGSAAKISQQTFH
jgi:hypothetical protein